MKALIDPTSNNKIAQVSPVEFEVCLPYFWVECPDEVTIEKYLYIDGKFVETDPNAFLQSINVVHDYNKLIDNQEGLLSDPRYNFSSFLETVTNIVSVSSLSAISCC
jgi:hypothetical protein